MRANEKSDCAKGAGRPVDTFPGFQRFQAIAIVERAILGVTAGHAMWCGKEYQLEACVEWLARTG